MCFVLHCSSQAQSSCCSKCSRDQQVAFRGARPLRLPADFTAKFPPRSQVAHGSRRAAHSVLSVQHQQHLQGVHQPGVRPVAQAAAGVQHVQEVLNKAELGVGLCGCGAAVLVVGQGSQGGHLNGVKDHWNKADCTTYSNQRGAP